MKKSLITALLLLAILVLAISACSNTAAPADTDTNGEVDEVKALIDERCSVCHSVSRVYDASYDEAGWSDVIDHMIEKGAEVNADEKALMIDWLLAQP
jgi:uncharacterized membrane protein